MARCGIAPAGEAVVATFEESADGAAPAFGDQDLAAAADAKGATVAATAADAARGVRSLSVAADAGARVAFVLKGGAREAWKEGPMVFRVAVKGSASATQALSVRLADTDDVAVATLGADAATRTASPDGEGWTVLTWTVQETGESIGLEKVAAVVLEFGAAGTVLIDDLAFADPSTRIDYALVDGARKVGETARIVWRVSDPSGRPAVLHTMRWMSSAGPSGPWEPIPDAVGPEYVIGTADADRFVAAEIVFAVGEPGARQMLPPVMSEPSGKVIG
jgi:hypothetical protein